MEKINCIFCKHNQAQEVITENSYCGKQCKECQLIYISPRPNQNEVIDLYGHDQAHVSAETHVKGSFLKRLYAWHTLKLIKQFAPKGTLLEIGSGAGYFLDEARKQGFKPYGIELNPTQINYMKNTLAIACEDKPLHTESFGTTSFDIIYHCDVISHFHDPITEFRTMYSKLNSNGYLVFETGNIGNIDKKYYDLFPAFQYPDHLFFFTEENLQVLLSQTGFELVKVYRYSIVPQLWFQKLLKKIFGSKNQKKEEAPPTSQKELSNNLAPSMLKKMYYRLLYFLRYQLGACMPKYKRPQTLIVIAKRK